jgi:Ran GTPase-activating protein (RanGAP) involved in mRNA processing and transport
LREQFGPEGVEKLALAIRDKKSLKCIDLSHNSIGKQGVDALSRGLQSLLNLSDLRLISCGCSDVKLLCGNLRNSKIRTLCLQFNRIEMDGILAMAELLAESISLRHLDIGQNLLTSGGEDSFQYLIECASKNKSLQVLHLELSSIGFRAASSFEKLLRVPSILRELHLTRNNIDYSALEILSYSLENNNSLEILDLSHNHIQAIGFKCLLSKLEKNKSLLVLDLSFNRFALDYLEILANFLLQNRILTHFSFRSSTSFSIEGSDFLSVFERNYSLLVFELSITSYAFRNVVNNTCKRNAKCQELEKKMILCEKFRNHSLCDYQILSRVIYPMWNV